MLEVENTATGETCVIGDGDGPNGWLEGYGPPNP